MGFHRHLELSISREEFFRLLPAAAGSFVADGDTIGPSDGSHRWLIQLVSLADHRVGSVVLPRHRVAIVLDECSEAEGEAFMDRFLRAFLRGGG
jgi:hypothetical protein